MAVSVQFFGEYLVARGLISSDQLAAGLAYQREQNLPLGQLAVDKGYLTPACIALINTEQRRTDKRFGELAVDLALLTPAQVTELLEGQAERRVYLGQALVRLGHLPANRLDDALAQFKVEQQEAEAQVRELLLAAGETDLVDAAVALTLRMLLRLTRHHAKVRDAIRDPEPVPGGYRTFVQQVKGDTSFWYALSLDFPVLMSAASALLIDLGEEVPPIVDELVLDAGKEFINVVVGHLCVALCRGGQKVMPEPPEVRPRVPNLGRTRVRVVIAMADGDALLDVVAP